MKTKVADLDGKPIILNALQVQRARYLERQIKNAFGYEIDLTTLTAISTRIVKQKFFTIPPALYMPFRVNTNAAWASQILTFREISAAGPFETGIINTGADNSRLANVDTGIDAVTVPIANWAKEATWSLIDLQMASRSGNWDLVEAKERARKTNWDLGIQYLAFLGMSSVSGMYGLLTLPNVNIDTTLITEYISGMTAQEFSDFVAAIIGRYRVNSNFTVMPNRFLIPELDYTGLAAPVSPTYPNVSKLEYLRDALRAVTMDPTFEVLPAAYANKAVNAPVPGLNKNRYVLYRSDEDAVRIEIPVDYQTTLAGTTNNFQFQNVGYGQFSGVNAYRPLELLYFDWG